VKILHKGQIEPTPSPWWVGVKMWCNWCRARMELEATDTVRCKPVAGQLDMNRLTIACPQCGGDIQRDIPILPQKRTQPHA
jgi:DNA-directed RNA polymerase subunit RPC12/RpoP